MASLKPPFVCFFLSFCFWKRETSICCYAYLCINWLIFLHALTWDQTHNLGALGWCFNQLNHPARAKACCFLKNNQTKIILHQRDIFWGGKLCTPRTTLMVSQNFLVRGEPTHLVPEVGCCCSGVLSVYLYIIMSFLSLLLNIILEA